MKPDPAKLQARHRREVERLISDSRRYYQMWLDNGGLPEAVPLIAKEHTGTGGAANG